jgi:hypothetical protein
MGIFGIAKRGKGIAKKIKQGKEWSILKKHPSLAKQPYSKSAVNKMLSKKEISDKPFGEGPRPVKAYQQRPNLTGQIKIRRKKLKAKKKK